MNKQKTRAERKKKLDEVLRSVGGTVTTGPEITVCYMYPDASPSSHFCSVRSVTTANESKSESRGRSGGTTELR